MWDRLSQRFENRSYAMYQPQTILTQKKLPRRQSPFTIWTGLPVRSILSRYLCHVSAGCLPDGRTACPMKVIM